ncbi:short-chain dehydrogenase [Alkalilimnicola ehrlichii]|uniref:Short-chain dehydrogenase n=1 Tax=Alkalilimnicola ehrlichii TaxID=351052 RepID=A0A3E0X000_9GAMM|nr:SDR family oxidoreductase [Alkalilimnicola ehrlichii]RFA29022.1 short-chain dehydrogenase [Alkalilimnicola ehrlichii]RFA38657.1 short-chain dehydrogenase [Alkalilimnicola ehrlichii]
MIKRSRKSRQVVVITGASAGIGRATAFEFARQGYAVGLIARGEKRLHSACSAIERQGGRALVLQADVTDPAALEQAAARAERELGPIDVWVNSAMATVFGRFDDITPDEYRQVTETTYLGTVNGTRSALVRMRRRDSGTIIQVGSALAYRAIPLQAAYCGAKHAIRGFTDSLRSELIYEGSRIRLSMVQLGAFNTPQFEWGRNRMNYRPQPVPPIYQPEVAAQAIAWTARHPRREVSVGATSVLAILGQKLAPRIMDWYMAKGAWEGQLTEQRALAGRPDNLFSAPKGDYGSHGRFDSEARNSSIQFLLSRNRAWLGSAVTAALAAGVIRYRHHHR